MTRNRLIPRSPAVDTALQNFPILATPAYRTDLLPVLIEQYQLQADDVDTLAYTCHHFHTSFRQLAKFLAAGYEPAQVLTAYNARIAAGPSINCTGAGVSLPYALLLQRTFPSLSEDDDLGERICEICEVVQEAMPWIGYADQAIVCLCDMARRHNLADYEAALDAICCPICDSDAMEARYE